MCVKLDSSDPGQPNWPCIAAQAKWLLRCDSRTGTASLRDAGGVIRQWADPLDALDWMERHIQTAPADSRWVGYLSYDLGRYFESLPTGSTDDLGLPLFCFALISGDSCDGGLLLDANEMQASALEGKRSLPRSNFTRDGYLGAAGKVIEYIRDGDVFQVNLSQRFSALLAESPAVVYERMRAANPARYGGLLDFGDHALICNSPELFLRVDRDASTGSRRIITRPIKGTRPRLPGMDVELRDSNKDQAELNMIVDLERNDLGRVCRVGSVRVSQSRVIEAHPTVFHGAATIEGVLRDDVSFIGILRAMFPGGSVTGAPKIRAMQIIEEFEPVRRGPYCGAIGYLAPRGHMQFNVAIRTMIVKDGSVYIPVGGGIVADSDPAAEYDETLVKARAMFAALGLSLPQ